MTRNVIASGFLFGLCLLLSLSAVQNAEAQDSVLTDMYGRGVHAFFRGDYEQCQKLLETVVEEGTSDPRVYYFLGLADFNMGQKDAADQNFTKGARLELSGVSAYPIGKSLERVQGSARLALESFRNKVRTETYLKNKEDERKRFEDLKRQEDLVLRNRDAKPAPAPVDVPKVDSTDPFGGDSTSTPPTPAPATPMTEPDTGSDPFGGSTPMPMPPATADPFGGSPAPTTPAPSTADPFGGSSTAPSTPAPSTPAPSTNDPFGGPQMPAQPSTPSDPFGNVPPPANPSTPSDPFGNVPEPANPSMPNDPFGNVPQPANPSAPNTPVGTPTTSDPFGSVPEPMSEPTDPFGAQPSVTEPPLGAPPGAMPTDDPFSGGPGPIGNPGFSSKPNPVVAAFGAMTSAMMPKYHLPPIPGMSPRRPRSSSLNNLKQIGLGLHNYHDTYLGFPPEASTNADGQKLLSWRVYILPYVEERAMYDQFHLDEPWDSEHNKQFIDHMPGVYRSPNSRAPKGYTTYLAPVGKGMAFEEPGPQASQGAGIKGLRFSDFTDGTSNTALIVEANDDAAVIWTKPSDLEVDLNNIMKGLAGQADGGFNVLFCDGSVRFISYALGPDVVKLLFQRGDGQVLPSLDSEPTDPFGAQPSEMQPPLGTPPAAAPPGADPFGAPPGGGNENMTPPGADPFGTPPGGGSDPFGAAPMNDPFGAAPAAQPAAQPAMQPAADPFGPAPTDTPEVKTPPSDPFGGTDPFGN